MIKTGKEPLPVLTFIAIMSVCFIINLPGVAVAPIEGKLKEVLHTSELEIQLLTTLPNFVLIPFVLIAGKLSDYKHKLPLIIAALVLFLGSGVFYLLTKTITGLIVASCLLGVANGILIPYAMGFIVNSFTGKYRTRNLGRKSAVSNFGTVVGSFFVGILIQGGDWHLPFIVYLIAAVPLALSYWLRYIPGFGVVQLKADTYQHESNGKYPHGGIDKGKIIGLIINNVWVTFVTFSIVIYLPQLLQGYGKNPKVASDVISFFFICVLVAGFVLERFIKNIKTFVFPVVGAMLTIGIGLFTFFKGEWAMYVGSVFAGLAFGIFQPLIYDKTSYAISDPKKNILGLSLVLTALYIAIAVEPFVITGLVKLFHIQKENSFAFLLSFFTGIAYIVCAFLFRKKFLFSIEPQLYS